jgi:hypothetical protein
VTIAATASGRDPEVIGPIVCPALRVQICLPPDDLEEADGNDDGNDGNQSRPQARSGTRPRAGNASGPGQLSRLKAEGRKFDAPLTTKMAQRNARARAAEQPAPMKDPCP